MIKLLKLFFSSMSSFLFPESMQSDGVQTHAPLRPFGTFCHYHAAITDIPVHAVFLETNVESLEHEVIPTQLAGKPKCQSGWSLSCFFDRP